MSNWEPWVSCGDIHGDQQDPRANKAFFKFLDIWNPTIRVLNGDLWDFRPLRNGASADEKRESMLADYEAGNRWLEKFKPTHFNRGNHDERLWELAFKKKEGPLSDLALRGVSEIEEKLRKMKCAMLPYHKRKVLQIGHLKWIHGFGGGGVNAASRHAKAYGSIIVNHFHSIQWVSIEGIENRVGRICGCLCYLDMDYNDRQIGSLVHRHGWPFGVINRRTGNYHCWQAENVDGQWVIPTGIKIL